MKRVQQMFIQQGVILVNVHSCFTRVIILNVYFENILKFFKLKTDHQSFSDIFLVEVLLSQLILQDCKTSLVNQKGLTQY